MGKFVNARMQNLPEMLAQDLSDQDSVFLSRGRTSGRPSVDLAREVQPPRVPQRNPSRALHRLHQVGPETFLCSLRQNSVESAWRSGRAAILKSAACRCPSSRALRQGHRLAPRKPAHMKQETEQDARRLFLNGLDEGWGSDSSADVETGLSSPSVRTRKQSITTAATSVDFQLNSGEKGMEEYPAEAFLMGDPSTGHHSPESNHPAADSPSGTYSADQCYKESLVNDPENQGTWLARKEGGSWVDLGDHAVLQPGHNEDGMSSRGQCQGFRTPQCGQDMGLWQTTHQPNHDEPRQPSSSTPRILKMDSQHQPAPNQPQVAIAGMPRVPRRRSSLSHNVTTGMVGGIAQVARTTTQQSPQELASQLLPSPPPTSPRRTHHSNQDRDVTGVAISPGVLAGSHQADHSLHLGLSPISPDQLSLPPLSATATTNRDRSYHDRSFSLRSQHQQPNLLSKPRKSHSITKLPLRNVQHWLESSNRARQHSPPLITTSPVTMSPMSSVRVSGHVLESLHMNIRNFPDTMLRTASVTIGQIRDYSHKMKRSDTTRQLLPTRESDEFSSPVSQSPSSPTSPNLGRKTSFGNLKRSFRSKFSRLTTPTSRSINEQSGSDWPPIDDENTTTARCDSPPLGPTAARDAACVSALRFVVPNGTPYLLDALYAHLIAYNYIDSLCGSLPEESPHLRAQSSKNVILPIGVTSLADLRVQEDVSDTIVKDFQDDITSVTSKNAVPSKAASLLGLGSTNMGKPIKPSPGSFGGRDNSPRKISPSGLGKGHYLESDLAMHNLREDIAHNIQRLVDTAEACSSEVVDTEEVQDRNMVRQNGKQLPPMLMRALGEIVRCYEDVSC